MKIPALDINLMHARNAGEVVDLWAQLTEAAKTDPEARAFLAMYEPWAKARLYRPLS